MTIKRRFIAGAKCPKCQAMDRVVMLTSNDDEWIECIDCGYSENRPTHVDEPQLGSEARLHKLDDSQNNQRRYIQSIHRHSR